MKLTVIAATGGVGRLLVNQALTAGHDVTAVARNPRGFDDHVRTAAVDFSVARDTAWESALEGSDAVLSCLGPPTRKDAGIVEIGTASVLSAAVTAGVQHFSMISATPVGTTASPARPTPPTVDAGDDFVTGRIMMPIIKLFFADVYADLAKAEDLVMASNIGWTIVRPPRLTDGPLTDRYRLSTDANVRGGRTISRADVAACLLRSATDAGLANKIVRVSG